MPIENLKMKNGPLIFKLSNSQISPCLSIFKFSNFQICFKCYLILAWRNLIKHRLNTIVNLLGLSVAFACSILLMLMVHREFSFDKFHANESSLFEVYSLSHGPDGDAKGTSMSYPVAPTLKSQVPGIIRTTGLLWAGVG